MTYVADCHYEQGNEGRIGFDGKPGSPEVEFNPIIPQNLEKIRFSEAAVGQNHVLALDTNGHIWVWGSGQQNQLGRKILARRLVNGLVPDRLGLRDVVHVGAGAFHSFALLKDGSVYSWGLNSFGQCVLSIIAMDQRLIETYRCAIVNEDGTAEDIISYPTEVLALHPSNNDGKTVIQVSYVSLSGPYIETLLIGKQWR